MQHTNRTTLPPAHRRAAFTLVELLVVIVIITILTTLAAAALMRFMESQEASNTRATLDKLQALLNSRWSTVTRMARDESVPPAVQSFWQGQNLLGTNYVGNDPNAPQRLKVMYMKLRQQQEFPMTFTEASNPGPLLPLSKFTSFFQAIGSNGAPQSPQPGESAILLLLALQSNQSGGGVSQDTLGGSTVGNVQIKIKTANGQTTTVGVKALVDGWGQPLAFCRYPSGNLILNPNGATTGPSRDPTDPNGYLMNPSWLVGSNGAAFLLGINQQSTLTNGPLTSFRLAPLIASSGPDRLFGLNLTTFAPTDATANDNLYSKPQ
jgi:prepilin-type N-terminal cleavage/methylation domain-containing protein